VRPRFEHRVSERLLCVPAVLVILLFERRVEVVAPDVSKPDVGRVVTVVRQRRGDDGRRVVRPREADA
jgi:hypothetical protein